MIGKVLGWIALICLTACIGFIGYEVITQRPFNAGALVVLVILMFLWLPLLNIVRK